MISLISHQHWADSGDDLVEKIVPANGIGLFHALAIDVRREPRIDERGVVVMAKKCHQACEAGEGEISSSCQKRDSNEHVSSDQSNICE